MFFNIVTRFLFTNWIDAYRLEDEVDVFYERLDEANAKEKKDERISNLRHIKTDAKRFSEDVNEHVGKVRVSESLDYHLHSQTYPM